MLLLVLVASVLASPYQPLPAQGSVVIRKHEVGPVSIGTSAQAVYSMFRGRNRLVDLALEGHLTPALELSFPETRFNGGVVAELVPKGNGLVVWRIAVTNPNVRTEKGIGVGSSVGELRSHYAIAGVGSGEGRVFVRVDELSASFELDRSGAGGDRLWQFVTRTKCQVRQRSSAYCSLARTLANGPLQPTKGAGVSRRSRSDCGRRSRLSGMTLDR